MNRNTARLLIVFTLALVATVARGQKEESPVRGMGAEVQWAGFGFAGAPQEVKKDSPKIVYSDEEVVIVENPEIPAR